LNEVLPFQLLVQLTNKAKKKIQFIFHCWQG